MPAGKLIKGKADITTNWAQYGAAVDYLTFGASGDAIIKTAVSAYPGESIPDGGTATLNLWWASETAPGTWTKIIESERQWVIQKAAKGSITLTLPEFTFKARVGDKLRLYGVSSIDDGAFIESVSPSQYLSKTSINFEEFTQGSEDEPAENIYLYEPLLENDWELSVDTEGRLQTHNVDDLPENVVNHVVRGDFSGNDFTIDGSGTIEVIEKDAKIVYTEVVPVGVFLDGPHNYVADTSSDSIEIFVNDEERNTFTIRDMNGTFATEPCYIRFRDENVQLKYTVTLNVTNCTFVFYHNGTTWKYGIIGKGKVLSINANRTASVDFADSILPQVYYAESLVETITTSVTYVNKLKLIKTFSGGTYLIDVSYNWDFKEDNNDFFSRVTFDGTIMGEEHIEEIKEKTRLQRIPTFRRFKKDIPAGSHTIALDFRTSDAAVQSVMSSAMITATKVNTI